MSPSWKFPGFDSEDFKSFLIPERELRRREIIRRIHPKLELLRDDILGDFRGRGIGGMYPHIPQLAWPPGYQPFCTWLAFSSQPDRYQHLAQLNLGVHEQYVSARLGFDTSGETFGRCLFLLAHGDLEEVLERIAIPAGLRCRAYRRAPWPEGSRAVFDIGDDFRAGIREADRLSANWFEIGERFGRDERMAELSRPDFAAAVSRIFLLLYPVYRRLGGP